MYLAHTLELGELGEDDLQGPRARKGRAMSSARGNWFDCTPTSMTIPPPAASIMRAERIRVFGLVEGVNLDVNLGPEHLAFGAVLGEAI